MRTSLDIIPLNEWLDSIDEPLIISGPCSAESPVQLLSTAKALSKIPNVKIFRAGIWKPRTRPDSFEGVGVVGLQWLQTVKQKTNLRIAVEVANPRHIEECLKYEVDILWIGARTVVSPFSIQEISNVLRGVDIPVMVKNPINPDIKLWLGALERINKSGIKKLVAIHRGFNAFDSAPYRNLPMWEIPIELKRLFPNLSIIVDPSHICGNREYLAEISQKAFDLNMDGLMIESHIDPDKALTDANQQITPLELKQLISNLIIRKEKGSVEFQSKLEELRTKIDDLDNELIKVLAKRMNIVKEIGEYKSDNNITILQLKRWVEIISSRISKGVKQKLNKEFLLKLLQLVHKESIQIQTDIMNQAKSEKRK